MNIDQIKQIKLQGFLAAMGCKPVKQYGVNLMYLSPLRTEKHASFKVNTEINQWYDFGIGRGGNIIALAELLYNSSDVSYLIHQIERNAPSSVSGVCPQSSQSHRRTPLSIFRCFLSLIQPLSNILKKGVLILKRQELCVRSCTLIQGASITLVLASPISQVATKYAIRFSKEVSLQKTSAYFIMKNQSNRVLSSRVSWTFFHL